MTILLFINVNDIGSLLSNQPINRHNFIDGYLIQSLDYRGKFIAVAIKKEEIGSDKTIGYN